MRQKLCLLLIAFSIFHLISCTHPLKKKHQIDFHIEEFKYRRTEAVGPEGLVCFITINDKSLRNRLLQNYHNHLIFKYSGGIYDIDTLYFPRPFIDVFSAYDSTLVFDQAVHELRSYPINFMDSIMRETQNNVMIEIKDTITNQEWTLSIK
jgi:hypothetical protein